MRSRSLTALDYLLDYVDWAVDPPFGKDIVELRNFLTGDQSTFYTFYPIGEEGDGDDIIHIRTPT